MNRPRPFVIGFVLTTLCLGACSDHYGYEGKPNTREGTPIDVGQLDTDEERLEIECFEMTLENDQGFAGFEEDTIEGTLYCAEPE